VSTDGLVAVDGGLAGDKGVYYLKNDSGKFKADFVYLDKSGFAILKIGAPLDDKSKLSYTVPNFKDLDKMKVGQKIIVFGSSISSFMFEGKNLNISATKSNAGALVFNLDGEVLGIALFNDTNSFVLVKNITDAVKNIAQGADATKSTAPKAQ
jgi:hypothetical protein